MFRPWITHFHLMVTSVIELVVSVIFTTPYSIEQLVTLFVDDTYNDFCLPFHLNIIVASLSLVREQVC